MPTKRKKIIIINVSELEEYITQTKNGLLWKGL